jgi:hypothetical protein
MSNPTGGLKLPDNPIIPDAIYDMVLGQEIPAASQPINIPQENPLAQSSIIHDLTICVSCLDSSQLHWKYY